MNPMLYFLESLDFLDWWLLGIVLGMADVFVPQAWLINPAIGAGCVGFVLMLFPQIAWPWQLAAFGMITGTSVIIRVAGTLRRVRVDSARSIIEGQDDEQLS